MEYAYKSLAAIDRALGRAYAPPTGLAACLAKAYPEREFFAQPDWVKSLLARLR
jgi:hypothetical protein